MRPALLFAACALALLPAAAAADMDTDQLWCRSGTLKQLAQDEK